MRGLFSYLLHVSHVSIIPEGEEEDAVTVTITSNSSLTTLPNNKKKKNSTLTNLSVDLMNEVIVSSCLLPILEFKWNKLITDIIG